MLNQRLFIRGAASLVVLCCAFSVNAVVPDSLTLNPTDDADGQYRGGVWSLFAPQDEYLLLRKYPTPEEECRAAMEFELTGLPLGAVVNLATLRLRATDINRTIGVYGYAGDAVVTATDLAVDDWLLSFDHNPEWNEVDVTAFVQTLVSSGQHYAGFALREEIIDHYAEFMSMEGVSPPELVIEYVPEPATLSLLLFSGLALLGRRK